MTGYELQLMRKLLFFSVAEAAEDISNTSARTWQRWEKGDIATPEDVISKLCWYLDFYHAVFDSYDEEIQRQLESNDMAYIPLHPTPRDSDLSRLAVTNIHQAVTAQLKADYGQDLEIVEATQ